MSIAKKSAKPAPQAEAPAPLPYAYFVYAERQCQDGSTTTFGGVVNTNRPILEDGEVMTELRNFVERRMDEASQGKRGRRAANSLIVKGLSYLGEWPAQDATQ